MDRPVYLLQAILDLRKTLMYEFHHNHMQPKYACKDLCYMDADNFGYEIETECFYMEEVELRLDISSYSQDNNRPLRIRKNKRVMDIMKDELVGKIMTKFVTLRAEMYVYIKLDENLENMGCNGKLRSCQMHTFYYHEICLFEVKFIYREQMLYQNKKTEMCMVNRNNRALHREMPKEKFRLT